MKKGFTLAEVLITLGIIGIVAAMTIPTMMQKNFEKRTVTQLRATQSVLSQALRMAEEEHGTMDGWVNTPKQDAATANAYAEKLKPFIKFALDCGVDDSKGKCIYNGTYRYMNGGNTMNYATTNFYYKIKLLNGASIWWRGSANDNKLHTTFATAAFFVDTNGANKPNQWGRDLFSFNYYPGVGLVAEGAPGSVYDYKTHCLSKSTTGWGCTYYVLNYQNMNYLHQKK